MTQTTLHVCICFSCRYNEEPLYSYDNPPQTTQEFYAGGYGHFTQVVILYKVKPLSKGLCRGF